MTKTISPVSARTMNLGHFLTQSAERLGSNKAIIRGDNCLSFAELNRRVNACCVKLSEMGVGKGDRILVQSRNCFEMFESMFVAFKLGAVWVPVNFRLMEEEVAYIASHSGAKVLVFETAFASHKDAAISAGNIELVISIGDCAGEATDDLSWNSLCEGDADFVEANVERDDPCWFFFTSGTTGRPKAAVLTHGQMGFVITNHIADLMPGLGESDASLVVAPLSHGAGIHQIAQVARGVVSVLLEGTRFNVEEVFALIERHKVTNMFSVPTILMALTDGDASDRYDHSSLKHVIYAGAPMYRMDQIKALQKLGPCLVQYFGLGEVTGNITVFPSEQHDVDDDVQQRLGTCGFARSAMQVQIQDDNGQPVPRHTTGEICVTGPAVFAGYYDNPEANEAAFRDGWFRTGDLGHMDPEGFVYITGRASDMYISGGSNIYPRAIEEKILQHAGVKECAIVGVSDAKWGEVGAMALVPMDVDAFDIDEFSGWMNQKIARYKIPQYVEMFDALPVSGYGKVTKKLVKAALEDRWLQRQAKE